MQFDCRTSGAFKVVFGVECDTTLNLHSADSVMRYMFDRRGSALVSSLILRNVAAFFMEEERVDACESKKSCFRTETSGVR